MEQSNPENLLQWSERMRGARQMLTAILEHMRGNHYARFDLEGGKDGPVYHKAIIKLLEQSPDNLWAFITQRQIGYRNHQTNAKGKLVSVEAYFL